MARIARRSSAPTKARKFDATYDIVVVGGGGAGLPAALFARWLGDDVVILEKAPKVGGTAQKAAYWYWVPNNKPMRALGIEDRKEDCIRYMARLSRPETYDADDRRFGMTKWEYDMCAAIYDKASVATELLAKKGALEYRHCETVPDYWAELPEDKAPTGRVLVPREARDTMSDGGAVAMRKMAEVAARDGVEVRTSHRVQRVVVNDAGRVIGVEADTTGGRTVRLRARKAVIFASGGFIADKVMRKNTSAYRCLAPARWRPTKAISFTSALPSAPRCAT